ncbi:sulfur oxidation c-type cytochrome SoxX [Stappia sp.]|uniref:sulfur oxidation c-type cytochrome SoxX n=1 Tax=Stappia sp. TaxID=1870903 RepID=UPI003A9A25A7
MKVFRRSMVAGCALLLGMSVAFAQDIVAYEVVDGTIPKSLTGTPGDPVAGREVMVDRRLGNCVACHTAGVFSDQQWHGEVGPPLDGVADRWDEASLRMIIVNAKAVYDGTIMPAFYRNDGFNRVAPKFAGKTIMSAQQVEDVVAYLMTLKD